MSGLTDKEVSKLEAMYEGDKNRDASDKVRGFLFQDYVTIMCLLKDKVEYVCSEYLEDVNVFYNDNTFEFIQVKYHPKTNTQMEEITTDLYYQFLRLKMLQSSVNAKPRLYIHKTPSVQKPTFNKMEDYLKIGSPLVQSVQYDKFGNVVDWLKRNVHSKGKKELQKGELFLHAASKETLQEFNSEYQILPLPDIVQYKKEVMEELEKTFPDTTVGGNKENRKLILLGLAISYVQRRYALTSPTFYQLRFDKQEFDSYMTERTQTKTEQTIVNYLLGIICEKYGDVIKNNELSQFQEDILYRIYKNTSLWIEEIGKTREGQYQLINTFSIDDADTVNNFKKVDIDGRLIFFAECRHGIGTFLAYLWKIMMNICQKQIIDYQQFDIYEELFNPKTYLNFEVSEYVCLKFQEDRYVEHSVILPSANEDFKGMERNIIERMLKTTSKPEKWYFKNSDIIRGKNYYEYSTADVNEYASVADLKEDSFYIECMKCIKVARGDWDKPDDCWQCVFSEECINEGE